MEVDKMSNDSVIGYVLLVLKNLNQSPEVIEAVINELRAVFDTKVSTKRWSIITVGSGTNKNK